MLEFHCRDVGVVCRNVAKARSQEELAGEIARHAADKHGVPTLNQTLIAYAVKHTRGASEPLSEPLEERS